MWKTTQWDQTIKNKWKWGHPVLKTSYRHMISKWWDMSSLLLMWISPNCCSTSSFLYLAAEWNRLHAYFQLWQPFPQISGLVFTSISWAALQAQIIALTSFLSGTSFEALTWWKIIQIKTAAEAHNRTLPDFTSHFRCCAKVIFLTIAASGALVILSPTEDGNIYLPHALVTWLVNSESALFQDPLAVLMSSYYGNH